MHFYPVFADTRCCVKALPVQIPSGNTYAQEPYHARYHPTNVFYMMKITTIKVIMTLTNRLLEMSSLSGGQNTSTRRPKRTTQHRPKLRHRKIRSQGGPKGHHSTRSGGLLHMTVMKSSHQVPSISSPSGGQNTSTRRPKCAMQHRPKPRCKTYDCRRQQVFLGIVSDTVRRCWYHAKPGIFR